MGDTVSRFQNTVKEYIWDTANTSSPAGNRQSESSSPTSNRQSESQLLPPPIECLSATPDGRYGSVTLQWRNPTRNWSHVQYCEIRYKKELSLDFKYRRVSCNCEKHTFTKDDGIEPLNKYYFGIRPIHDLAGLPVEWTSTDVFIRWFCKLPHCMRDRRKRRNDNSVSDFCSSNHAREFSTHYCFLPGCFNYSCDDSHFCCPTHREEAERRGCCGVVPLEKTCKDYKDLQTRFSEKWSKKKGQQPEIISILKVVNPFLEERLKSYSESLPKGYREKKRYYHGTHVKCDISEYLQPCSDSDCAVCSITRQGFDPNRISSNSWQRFGGGFYLAPNSSKSYDYPITGQGGSTNLPYRVLLVCDVARGRRYILHKNEPYLQGPPPGYHSVYGQAKWLLNIKHSPHLNYDELVVFNKEALRPSFIILCENLL